MKEINVIGQTRKETGKKASKELRKEGLIPCNLYGELKDENGKAYAYRDAAGNYYEMDFGLRYDE